MRNLEIRKVEIPSLIDNLKVGNDFTYKGYYKDGYEEGISKIKRFYKEVPFWDGIEKKVKEKYGGGNPVWMELENNKIVLLGFLQYKDRFEPLDKYKNLKR